VLRGPGRQAGPDAGFGSGVAQGARAAGVPRDDGGTEAVRGRRHSIVLRRMSRLKVGVIGAGAWGRNHVRTLATLTGAELVCVCDANEKTREKLSKQY